MNRLTNAFSSAIPSSGSDGSSMHLRERTGDSPRVSSPLDPSFNIPSHPHLPSHYERRHIVQSLIYDDPRTIYHPISSSPSARGNFTNNLGLLTAGIIRPGRPGLLRHLTDDGSGRLSGSQAPTPRVRSQSRSRERDRGIRVNLMSTASLNGKRGWGMNSATKTTRLNAMAQGPEGTYAIGGGQYLRVMKIHDPSSGSTTPIFASDETKDRHTLAKGNGGVTISEVVNLWKPNWPVGKGVNGMDWGVGAFDTKIATATPSGNLLLFDVEKGRLDKDISSGTFRPMNCVRLCPSASHGHLALTGGTEGGVRFWDLRERDPSNRKALKHSSAIISLTFCPTDAYQFVAGLDDGSIRRYDFRSPSRSTGKAFGAHGSKSVLDLKWKEGDEESSDGHKGGGWLASAGADKIVQIWDMGQQWDKPPSPVHSLHTAYPVRRVAWRPDHPTELVVVPLIQAVTSADPTLSPNPSSVTLSSDGDSASHAGLDEDAHLEIWHVRRHYIAKYAIPTQDGGAVDVAWANGDGNLVACFQNGGFAQMELRGPSGRGSLPLPLDQVPRQLVGWSPRGEMVYAVDRFKLGEIPFDDVKSEYVNHWDKLGRPTPSISDPAYEPLQTLGFLPLPDTDEVEFAYLANWYKLEGDTPENLCQWNGNVALSCGREDDARLWAFLKTLLEEFDPSPRLQVEAGFKEDVFSGTIDGTARLSTPPTSTPTHGSPNHNVPYPSPTAIPLTRLGACFLDEDEEALSEPSESSSSTKDSYSDSESEEESHHPKSRFLAFSPPDSITRRLSDALSGGSTSRRESNATVIMPNSRSVSASVSNAISAMKMTKGGTTGTSRSSSGSPPAEKEKENSTMRTSTSKKSSSSKMTSSRIMAMSDYPDPYGIQGEFNFSGSTTTATISRTSPTPINNNNTSNNLDGIIGGKSLRSSPLPFPSLRKGVGTPEGPLSRRNSAQQQQQVQVQGVGMIKVPTATALRGEVDRFDKNDWFTYQKRRVDALHEWWEGCIDDGEMQLATHIAIVGSKVGEFPSRQVEGLVHAYVDMLERLRLPIPASYIRLYSHIPSLQIAAINEGITHKLHCGRCGKSTGELDDIGVEGKKFWWCKKCKMGAKVCSICRKVVKGLYLGCKKCGHGGHGNCMRVYHNQAPLLPLHPITDHVSDGNASLARTSTGTLSTTEHGEIEQDIPIGGWSVCPTGCGCRCRRV